MLGGSNRRGSIHAPVLPQREMENWGAGVSEDNAIFGGPVCTANAVAAGGRGSG
jgi:hypothetical protein